MEEPDHIEEEGEAGPPPVSTPSGRSRPAPPQSPIPRGKVLPGVIGTAVAVGVAIRELSVCHDEAQRDLYKDIPHKEGKPRKTKRRTRKCRGNDKPEITYTDRRRRLGLINHTAIPNIPNVRWKDAAHGPKYEKLLKDAGVSEKGSQPVRIEVLGATSEDVAALGMELEVYASEFGGLATAKQCWYCVWLIEERRHCTCPDGSPCRSNETQGSYSAPAS